MKVADLNQIEAALEVTLPDVYRSQVLSFPIRSAEGNSDSVIWDDGKSLIALNQRLRLEVPDWPAWLFAVGQSEGDPSGWAIDTRSSDAPMWWLEQMRLGSASGPANETFVEWFGAVAADLDEQPSASKSLLRAFAVWVVLTVIGVAVFWAWTFHRAR